MKNSVIVVDIGNTSTSFALANAQRIGRMQRLPTQGVYAADIQKALRQVIGTSSVQDAALCSVVPGCTALWAQELRRLTGRAPLIVSHRLKLGLDLDYPKPDTIGPDRLANVSGAVARYGAPVIVADFGTAATFDVVSARAAFLGGVIVPGIALMTDYLADRTALLPRLELRAAAFAGTPLARRRAIGRSTTEAMTLGARWGYLGMVREIIGRLKAELSVRRVRLVATGGHAAWLLKGLDLPFVIDPGLTLFGVWNMYQLNRRVGTPSATLLRSGRRTKGRASWRA